MGLYIGREVRCYFEMRLEKPQLRSGYSYFPLKLIKASFMDQRDFLTTILPIDLREGGVL